MVVDRRYRLSIILISLEDKTVLGEEENMTEGDTSFYWSWSSPPARVLCGI